jgi:hypothetical protein
MKNIIQQQVLNSPDTKAVFMCAYYMLSRKVTEKMSDKAHCIEIITEMTINKVSKYS